MTQKRLVEMALSGAKTKQLALWDGYQELKQTKPDAASAIYKALQANLDDIRELTEMLEEMENG